MNPFEAIAVLGTVSVLGFVVVASVKSITHAVSRKSGGHRGVPQEEMLDLIDALQREVATLREDLGYRMDDLDERVDFAERMLQKGNEPNVPRKQSKVIGLTPI